MFRDEHLENELKHSHTVESGQASWAEINMNASYNIDVVGNYRYRPGSGGIYATPAREFDPDDLDNAYTGATDADTVVFQGLDNTNTPLYLTTQQDKIKFIYSLDDCFTPHRPRSGINKLMYFGRGQYLSEGSGSTIAQRPRYYMGDRNDIFKYWTSYRTEKITVDNIDRVEEYGISQSKNEATGTSIIDDVVPFVVYKNEVPTNKVVLKVQTNIGSVQKPDFRTPEDIAVSDPFYGEENSTVPKQFTIQYLDADNKWIDAKVFNEYDVRDDGSPIFSNDGYLEIGYGLLVPEEFRQSFKLIDIVSSNYQIPEYAPLGHAYILAVDENDVGTVYISDGGNWITYTANYGWTIGDNQATRQTKTIKQITNPQYFVKNNKKQYREFHFVKGLRIVVTTMNKENVPFDLIELSPRLLIDITEKVENLTINKPMANLGESSLPTGQLLASTGNLTLFDDDLAFTDANIFDPLTNDGSVLAGFCDMEFAFTSYQIIGNVDVPIGDSSLPWDFYVPLKTMYSDAFPETSNSYETKGITLRDGFKQFEAVKSPDLLMTNVSLSYAVSVLLDNIGFSNYLFLRDEGETELMIPYFYCSSEQNVAQTLQDLARSSQCAMWFDEYNNFVTATKGYIIPDSRDVDMTLYGQEEFVDNKTVLPNIESLSANDKKVYNDGQLNYTTRYIQRGVASIRQAPYSEKYKDYVYKPVQLWEVAGQEQLRTKNETAGQQSGFSLSAIPLRATLTDDVPELVDGQLINNVMDFGESSFWITDYEGYFYANGEIIRYDAVQYSVQNVGNVWITNNQEYQKYLADLTFNGKIYTTGLVRIYTLVEDGELIEHGRGQFGTPIVTHQAGINQSSTWVNNSNVRGMHQSAKQYLFNTDTNLYYPEDIDFLTETGKDIVIDGETYNADAYAVRSTRNGIIRNFMAGIYPTETETTYLKNTETGTVQSSALVFGGPTLPAAIEPSDFTTYVYKNLDKQYSHYGTRMRIIGKILSNSNADQEPLGLFDLYPTDLTSNDPSKAVAIRGGGGGLGFGVNPDKNIGYWFEIDALTQSSTSSFSTANKETYNIVKSPVVQVVDDIVTITLDKTHTIQVGDKVTVSGVSDINDKENPTAINGSWVVTAISQDRKQLQYSIKPTITTAPITNAVGTGTTIAYTSNHDFVAGHKVTVSGYADGNFNGTFVVQAVSRDENGNKTFIVNKSVSGTDATIAQADYVSLTTYSESGGKLSVSDDSEVVIANVLFYKTLNAANTIEVLKKSLTTNVATLTTIRNHSFVAGEQVDVNGVGAPFDGVHIISSVTPNTISYEVTNANIGETASDGTITSVKSKALTKVLYRGQAEILVDDGKFTSQSRLVTNEKTTVYDLAAEYVDRGSTREFFLYINDKQIATVVDEEPLPKYQNMALFTRGTSRIMFENVYALTDNLAYNQAKKISMPVSQAFTNGEDITQADAIRRYGISGIVQSTYLSGISSSNPSMYELYYEEFGTIMRGAKYFNIKYDQAFPAIRAIVAPTVNRAKGYTVSGLYAGSYGAEFLVFNNIDKNLMLGGDSGNYLKMLGISFTQNTSYSMTVDDFFRKNSNFNYSGQGRSSEYKEIYQDIQNSRNRYGVQEFTLDTPYIQTEDAAEAAMDWVIKKTMTPKKTVGMQVFGVPHLQLGDIVNIDYKTPEGVDVISDVDKKYVVYNIEHKLSEGEIATVINVAEV